MSKILYVAVYIIIFSLISIGQSVPDQKEPSEPAEAEIVMIPVTEITEQADKTYVELQELLQDLKSSDTFSAFEEELPVILDSLKKFQSNKKFNQLAELELRVLNSFHQEWKLYQNKLDEWKTTLLTNSQEVENKVKQLKEMNVLWRLTQEEAVKEKTPRAIKSRITDLLKMINESEKQVKKRLDEMLILQNSISKSQNEINELIKKITEAENLLRGQIFVRDSPPLWEALQAEPDSVHIALQFKESWTVLFRSNVAFVNVNANRFYLHMLIFAILLVLTIYIHIQNKKKQLFNEDDLLLKDSAYFIARPFSAALLIALFLSIWIYPNAPATVGEFLMLLLLIPVIRLVKGMLIWEIRKPVYIMAVIYVFDILQKNAIGFVVLQRMTLLVATLIVIITLGWLLRPGSAIRKRELKGGAKFLRRYSPVVLFFLFVSFIANIYGSVSLANTLTWGVVESALVLVTMYITASVASGLITVLIRRRRARALQFVKTYAYSIERWAKHAIFIIAVLVWARATLRIFGLLGPLKVWFEELRETTWTVGAVVISISAIVDFILVIIFTFILIRVVRIFLDMEIFPRLKLPKGLPAAINMMIRYTLVALGIILALSSLGIDLGKFGILAGALGVGLGFGLQKIVANFISSLILAFGRQIRVGDTVQYDDVLGNVKEIGVNASTVRSFDGSDAIIPNADLISNKVTNWTLLDMQRRMLLPVKVAFGNNPHEVLKILEKVALDNPDVLKSPEPFSVFNGFGDNFLDFSLYYWIPTSLFFKVKTEVALAVHDAITAKGIETPRPQRDLRVTLDESADSKQLVVKAKSSRSTSLKKRTPKSKRVNRLGE